MCLLKKAFHKSEPYARSVIWKRSGHGAKGIMVSIKSESPSILYFVDGVLVQRQELEKIGIKHYNLRHVSTNKIYSFLTLLLHLWIYILKSFIENQIFDFINSIISFFWNCCLCFYLSHIIIFNRTAKSRMAYIRNISTKIHLYICSQ